MSESMQKEQKNNTYILYVCFGKILNIATGVIFPLVLPLINVVFEKVDGAYSLHCKM